MGSCWIYGGYLEDGYGRAKIDGRMTLVHRASYEALVGPIPDGLQLDHLCRNRACYNPAHLEPVTQQENGRRGLCGVLRTQCPAGHPCSESNTYRQGERRKCRICNRAAVARYKARKAAR